MRSVIMFFASFTSMTAFNVVAQPHASLRTSRVLQENSLVNDANLNKANAVSAGILDELRAFRGQTTVFYKDLLNALVTTQCDQETKSIEFKRGQYNPLLRFVTEDDEEAYKDTDGNCIRVLKPEDDVKMAYSQGLCEIAPTCFWGPIEMGDAYRTPVYSTTAGRTQPPVNSMDVAEANTFLTEWTKGLVMLIAPGLILASISLITLILFTVCRFGCNSCGGKKPRPEGYTCIQKILPLFFFILFSGGILSTAAISVLYNSEVNNAIDEIFTFSTTTLEKSSDWIIDARTPLIDISASVMANVKGIKVTLNGTDFIETGLDGITSKLATFGANTADVSLPRGCDKEDDLYCFACSICDDISAKVSLSTTEIRGAAQEGVAQLANARADITTELTSNSDNIVRLVDEKVNAMDKMMLEIDLALESVTEINETWNDLDQYRGFSVLLVFALSILVVVLGLIGIFFGLTPLRALAKIIHLAYMIGFIALITSFAIASTCIAVSILLADVCEVTVLMKNDWAPVVGAKAALGLNACFQNDSLLSAYNLTNSLDYEEMIAFPKALSIASMLDFSSFDEFSVEILKSNSSTFTIDPTQLPTAITLLNSYTNQNSAECPLTDALYSSTNVVTPWIANGDSIAEPTASDAGEVYMRGKYNHIDFPGCDTAKPFSCTQDQSPCHFVDFLIELWRSADALRRIDTSVDVFVVAMKANMTDTTNYISQFKTNVINLDESLSMVGNDLESSLFTHTNKFEKAMYCNFIEVHFDDIFETMCGNLLPALLMISLMIFLMAIFLIPVNICLIILCKRLQASGNGAYVHPDETKLK